MHFLYTLIACIPQGFACQIPPPIHFLLYIIVACIPQRPTCQIPTISHFLLHDGRLAHDHCFVPYEALQDPWPLPLLYNPLI